MANRVPVFELHIRPMFRPIDRDHMLFALDLWKLEDVWTHRVQILNRVKGTGDMPTRPTGGPWPDEWIAVFERWIQTGTDTTPGHHLVLGAPSGDYSIKNVFGGKIEVGATVSVPGNSSRVWFNLEEINGDQRHYTLVVEPPFPPEGGGDTTMAARERFTRGSANSVLVTDASGTHELPFP